MQQNKTMSASNRALGKGSILTWLDERIRFILLIPAFTIMVLIFFYPVGYTFYLSFHDWTFFTLTDPPFIGLQHILDVFQDKSFYMSMFRTALYVGVGVFLQLFFGFTLALAVNRMKIGHGVATTLLVLPMMVTPVVVGLMWKFIFDYNFGVFNYMLTLLGFEKLALLSSNSLALPSIIMVDTWQWTSFMFITLLAGLKSLPNEPFEAAKMDGATAWQTFCHVTLPLMKRIIIVSLVLRTAGSIKVFDQIFVLTGGGPGTATETTSILLHRKAFVDFDFGYGAALAIVLTVIVGIICWFAIRSLYSEK
ncbi:carbohydrate ABC transporter permease [Paenibacillus radicis (ex Xue et al. 2023)]|uniref:Sugar ABC transporter permease n=1 Tax=Paenibacillus radicis (ex Xue et al. 2023) TaxID=2972489 RepID=A0ABT1YV43_9BACL|nr:sugar ABC transporter permease [Paenibacillus radicis (ex Xue et al. 2023)]MCR8636820.1 sugar ABC transporter permease [Paenibacillus radicis (ex Xue et al. 2023)]